jgi:hypothetical protein
MNLDALPYASFIVLTEFCVGCLIVCLFADWRGQVAASFVKFCAAMVSVAAVVLVLNGLALDPRTVIGGYRLHEDLATWVQAGSVVFLVASLPYTWLVLRERRQASMYAGLAASAVGLLLVGLTAYYVSLPTWGFAGTLMSLLAGTLAVGAVTIAMTLGHWYLVTPRLPRQPLEELTLLMIAAIALQAVLLVVNATISPRETPEATAFLGGTDLGTNPAFWLRIAIGLVFAGALGVMAYVSSRGYPANENAMMSATGLLYIAVAAVIVGQVLARGLLFLTASPV